MESTVHWEVWWSSDGKVWEQASPVDPRFETFDLAKTWVDKVLVVRPHLGIRINKCQTIVLTDSVYRIGCLPVPQG
jgi:hypothetical protein